MIVYDMVMNVLDYKYSSTLSFLQRFIVILGGYCKQRNVSRLLR